MQTKKKNGERTKLALNLAVPEHNDLLRRSKWRAQLAFTVHQSFVISDNHPIILSLSSCAPFPRACADYELPEGGVRLRLLSRRGGTLAE